MIFGSEYDRQSKAMIKAIGIECVQSLCFNLALDYRPGRRWGRTPRARARRWASWIRRRARAGMKLKMNTAHGIYGARLASRLGELRRESQNRAGDEVQET